MRLETTPTSQRTKYPPTTLVIASERHDCSASLALEWGLDWDEDGEPYDEYNKFTPEDIDVLKNDRGSIEPGMVMRIRVWHDCDGCPMWSYTRPWLEDVVIEHDLWPEVC